MDDREKAREILRRVEDRLVSLSGYNDVLGFVMDLDYHVGQLDYFYNKVVPHDTGDASTTIYRPKIDIHEHELIYFNLTRGFPKELYGGHWCYVVKLLKGKCLVIPTTSVKVDGGHEPSEFQMDIEIADFNNSNITRLQLSDMRTVDIQRVYSGRGSYKVTTERKKILSRLAEIII